MDDILGTGGWLVETYHGIQDYGGWEATPLDVFAAHVEYVAGKGDLLWIDTIADIAKYICERDSASVKLVKKTRDKIVISLTDTMDDEVFDAPLTLRVAIPSHWSSPITVAQSGRRDKVELTKETGRVYAHVDAIPDLGDVVLSPIGARRAKAPARPSQPREAVSLEEQRASDLLGIAREMQNKGLDKDNIQRVLEQIVQQYPKTKGAEEARKMLATLK